MTQGMAFLTHELLEKLPETIRAEAAGDQER